jgi:SSS family solute:Na+ symporter
MTADVVDLTLLVVFLVALVAWTCGFFRKSQTADDFMAAGRSLPAWVVGLSLFGSYVSSITFLSNPGKAFASNWNPWVFALSLPLAAWIATRCFVPFFRRSGEVSAYQHLEHRFGPWARTYGVACYLLTQIFRLGTILYLLALALEPMLPVGLVPLIILGGLVTTVLPFFGGTAGVMWAGVVQSLVLLLGVGVAVSQLLWTTPGGLTAIATVGIDQGKFSLGSTAFDVSTATVWVTFAYGLTINLQNFGIDQSYVQKYITARSDRAARQSVWFGGLAYIPLSAAFLWIGTALFVFYLAFPDRLPEGIVADKVFPWFLRTELPSGLRGIVLAAVCAAALDSNLNCCATLYLKDIHQRYLSPGISDAAAVWTLRLSTLVLGVLSTLMAVTMQSAKTVLDQWWNLAGIASGGLLGLFLLGLWCPRATSRDALIATLAGVVTICGLSLPTLLPPDLAPYRLPIDPLLTTVIGTLTIFLLGGLLSLRHHCSPKVDLP